MLQASELMVFYENMLALNNVSITASDGQIVGIFGSNSAGKSTLMYTLSGIMLDIRKKEQMRGGERISLFGSIKLDGHDISSLKPHLRAKQGVILCPERRRIFPESSVMENLKIGAYLASKRETTENIDYVLNLFPRLKDHLNRQGGFLSGGEQQMLAIGRALMAKPKVLLLDEPLLGLSPAYQKIVVNGAKAIRDAKGITIIITEQYARPVIPIIDYGYILENGSNVLSGSKGTARQSGCQVRIFRSLRGRPWRTRKNAPLRALTKWRKSMRTARR
jgi:branched-chain amino acid transport system ATP-binding protein